MSQIDQIIYTPLLFWFIWLFLLIYILLFLLYINLNFNTKSVRLLFFFTQIFNVILYKIIILSEIKLNNLNKN